MEKIEVKDRSLPVEASVKANSGRTTEKFDNMEGFEKWFDPKRHRLTGHLADDSMTMINVELIEEPVKKAKKPTKAVIEKGDELRKEQLASDAREEKRAKGFKERVKVDAASQAAARSKTESKKATKASETPKGKAKPASPSKKGEGAHVRHSVKVTSPSFKGTKEFSSLRYAFEGLKMSWASSKFQKFRMELKAKGKGTFESDKGVKYDFVAVAK